MRKMLYKISNFFRWIIKSIQYSWFLRNDFDWDYGFLLKLIRFKLARMAKTIRSNEIIEANERVAKQIEYAVYLIDRYNNDDDFNRLQEEHSLKWGQPKYDYVDGERFAGSKTFKMITTYPKASTPEKHAQASKQATEFVLAAYAKEQELIDRLFRHTGKYLRGWWD